MADKGAIVTALIAPVVAVAAVVVTLGATVTSDVAWPGTPVGIRLTVLVALAVAVMVVVLVAPAVAVMRDVPVAEMGAVAETGGVAVALTVVEETLVAVATMVGLGGEELVVARAGCAAAPRNRTTNETRLVGRSRTIIRASPWHLVVVAGFIITVEDGGRERCVLAHTFHILLAVTLVSSSQWRGRERDPAARVPRIPGSVRRPAPCRAARQRIRTDWARGGKMGERCRTTIWTRCWRAWTRGASRSRTPSGAGTRGRPTCTTRATTPLTPCATTGPIGPVKRPPPLPDAWIAREPRPRRNGRDYSDLDEAQARFTLADLRAALAHDRAAGRRVRALHVRYGDGGDDRYLLVADAADGQRREIASPEAYRRLYRTGNA